MRITYPVFEDHIYFCPLCSSFLLTSDLPLPFCLSPLYLPWCKKGSKHSGCQLQLELHLFLSMTTTNVIISVTVVNVAIECSHSLMIQYSLQGTGEFQGEPFKMPTGSGSSNHHYFLYLLSYVFSSSIRKARNALLFCPLFQKKEISCLTPCS